MNKEENLKMVIPEIEPLQKKQLDEESAVYQPCNEENKVKIGHIKQQVCGLIFFGKALFCYKMWKIKLILQMFLFIIYFERLQHFGLD